jgi:uncharacterized protein (DUF2235 family)
MRNLIVCCDGTWNTPDQQHDGVATPTNVYRLYNAIQPVGDDGTDQIAYYHPGVGSEGNWWQKLAGGGFGLGLTKNIMSGYRWLGGQYQTDDRIFLFGFSRGAYTVRSLAGMITHCGLLDLTQVEDGEVWGLVERATRAYRERQDRSEWARGLKFHGRGNPKTVQIHYLGVWDTVGSLGVPNDLAILNLIDEFSNLTFHDTKLNANVLNARHAVAIDERRLPFSPTLWTGKHARTAAVKQVWFPGVHSDVGGGYAEIGLSNLALQWMMEEAAALGLHFHEGMVRQVVGNPFDVMHESYRGAIKGLKSRPRSVPDLAQPSQRVHPAVRERMANPPIAQGRYRKTEELKVGEARSRDVFAVEPWNSTGLYLRSRRTYRFRASGQWLDWHDRSGPEGLDDGKFQIGDIARKFGSALGLVERAFKHVTKNEEADIKFTKREEDKPWFCLVGAIANGSVTPTGIVRPHESFAIGKGPVEITPARSGYLYAYANDAWHMYDNNRGSVQMTIERIR